MKHKKVIQIFAENLSEENFILEKFPGVWWELRDGATVFDIPIEKENEVIEIFTKYKELVKK